MDSLEKNNNFTLSEDINGPLLATVVGIEMVSAIIINCFVLVLTCYSKSWKQPSSIFMSNLLLTNLFTALFVMPFTVISTASGEWIFGHTIEQKVRVCDFSAYLFWYSVLLVTESLVIISFDRFFFIVKAFHYRWHMSTYKAIIVIMVSWILAALLNLAPFFGLGRFEFLDCCGACVPRWEDEQGYVTYHLVIFILCITSIIVTSTWTYCFTRKFLRSEESRLSFATSNDNNVDIYAVQQRKLIGVFGMLMLVHLLCYLPGLATSGIGLVTPLPIEMYPFMYVLFLLITVLSPLVQSCFRRDIRNTALRFFRSLMSLVIEERSQSSTSV